MKPPPFCINKGGGIKMCLWDFAFRIVRKGLGDRRTFQSAVRL